jgi:hypothetical protein
MITPLLLDFPIFTHLTSPEKYTLIKKDARGKETSVQITSVSIKEGEADYIIFNAITKTHCVMDWGLRVQEAFEICCNAKTSQDFVDELSELLKNKTKDEGMNLINKSSVRKDKSTAPITVDEDDDDLVFPTQEKEERRESTSQAKKKRKLSSPKEDRTKMKKSRKEEKNLENKRKRKKYSETTSEQEVSIEDLEALPSNQKKILIPELKKKKKNSLNL